MNAKVLFLQLGDDFLECIAVAAGNPNYVSLNGRLDFDLRVLDKLHDFFRLFLRNALLYLSSLPYRTTRSRFDSAVVQSFQWNAAANKFLLKDIIHIPQLGFIFCG